MSRKHCKRKIWATKGFDAVAHAIAGACITNKASLDALQIRELSAVESITHGHGTVQDWRDLQRQSIPRSKYEEISRKTAWRIRSHAPEVVEV
jgi:hypothetical protein